ncbi:glutamate racemase [soil metagenome]|nr:glutamate racemase [Gemmatimonadota bacterium]
MSSAAPIGIFDSGMGGLSVAREIRALLPAESLLYLADTAYCPYGGRPLEEIRARTLAVGQFLVDRGAKALIVACNSASGAALEALRAHAPVPVIGMEPAVKPAAECTRNGRVGVMATAATLHADRFDRLMENFARHVQVVAQACPGLVELVERGEVTGEEAARALQPILEPLRSASVDTVVLGCTHFPFLKSAIAEVLGPDVVLIDSGAAVARQTKRILLDGGVLRESGAGEIRIFTTGDEKTVALVAARLWGEPVPVERAEFQSAGEAYASSVQRFSCGGDPSAGRER